MFGLKIHQLPQLDNPIMIASLPDMGNVAGLGLNLIIKKLNAKLFAEIYAFWPPAISYNKGKITYEQSSYKFHYCEKENLVIFSGEFNPSDPRRLYEICNEVVEMAKKVKTNTIFSIGAALRETVMNSPKIFGAATSDELLEKLKQQKIDVLDGTGKITGFNGLVLGIAQEHNLNGMCILGEIDNPNIIQPMAASKIIDALSNILGITPIDTSELEEQEKKKKFLEQQMSYMEELGKKDNQPGIA